MERSLDFGEGRLPTHCCQFPHGKGWTAADPLRTFALVRMGIAPKRVIKDIAARWRLPSLFFSFKYNIRSILLCAQVTLMKNC